MVTTGLYSFSYISRFSAVVTLTLLKNSMVTATTAFKDPVVGQYNDYPYPGYGKGDYLAEKSYYISHTDCKRCKCKDIVNDKLVYPANYMFTISLDLLNTFLYKVKFNSYSEISRAH